MVNKVILEGTMPQSATMGKQALPVIDETEYMPLEEMHKRLVAHIKARYA